MPVPKKRVGASDQGHRRSCWKATVPTLAKCNNCGDMKFPHMVCTTCGFYNGRLVSECFNKVEA